MGLNSYILLDSLGDSVSASHISAPLEETPLMHLRLFCEDIDNRSDVLYVARADDISPQVLGQRYTKRITIACIGHAEFTSGNVDVIEFDPSYNLVKLFGLLQDTFDYYLNWERALQECIIDGGILDDIFQISFPIFGNPLGAHDNYFRILGQVLEQGGIDEPVKNIIEGLPYKTTSGNYLTIDEIQRLSDIRQPETSYDVPTLVTIESWNITSLMRTAMSRDNYQVTIFVDAYGRDFRDGDYGLLNVLTEYVQKVLDRPHETKKSNLFYQTLIQMVSGKINDRQSVERNLKYHAWSLEHSYLVGTIYLFDWETQSKIQNALMLCIEKEFSNSRVFVHEGRIVVIVNLSIGDEDSDVLITKMNEFFNGYQMSLFISNQAKSGIDLPNCLLQALWLRKYITHREQKQTGADRVDAYYGPLPPAWLVSKSGKAVKSAGPESSSSPDKTTKDIKKFGQLMLEPVYLFEDYKLDYFLRKGLSELPFEYVCPICLKNIIEYDVENGTEYFNTLRVYLHCNMSQTAASEALFIHRSTFYYRLDRLQKMLGGSLEDQRFRLLLLLFVDLIGDISTGI